MMKFFLHLLAGVLCAGLAYALLFHIYPLGLDETLMWVIVGASGIIGLIFGPLIVEVPMHLL